MRSPVTLLLLVGFLLAANLGIARAVIDGGASALLAAFSATMGAGVVLLAVALLAQRPQSVAPRRLGFYALAGAISYALPNALIFAVADRIGAAYAAILYAFVPGLTYLIALGWGVDSYARVRMAGVVLGLAGATTIILARLELATDAQTVWIVAALVAPISVALGNVVRSRYWPRGAQPLDIAPGLLIAAGLQLGLATLVGGWGSGTPQTKLLPLLLAQVAVSVVFYALYFRLQHIAGPVYLSQIGYVATAFAIPIALIVFAEAVTLPMLGGIALVVLGIMLVRPARPPQSVKSAPVMETV